MNKSDLIKDVAHQSGLTQTEARNAVDNLVKLIIKKVGGGQSVNLRRAGVFEFDAASISQAMVGTEMEVTDDHTFDDIAGTTNHVKVGQLVKYVSATKGWIDIAR